MDTQSVSFETAIEQVDQLRRLSPQNHVSVLACAPSAAERDSLTACVRDQGRMVMVCAEVQADIPEAIIMALRTAPRVLAVAGVPALVSDTLGALVALQQEHLSLPAIALLNTDRVSAAAQCLGMHGTLENQLAALARVAARDDATAIAVQTPLLRLSQGPQTIRQGLVFASGAYAKGLGAGYEALGQSSALMKLHLLSGASKANDGQPGPNDLARIAPDRGGSVSTYLFGALISVLPLSLLSHPKASLERPIRYMAIEKSRKARMAALRAMGGQTDRATTYYGVHSGSAGALSVRLPGPFTLDGLELALEASVNITPTAPLPLLDLARVE